MTSTVLLEVCVASVDDAVAAERGGADRLELNQALEVGGLTPSRGLLMEVLDAVAIPVIAMVRPRGAGFRYSSVEQRVLLRDAESLLTWGAAGVAAGAIDSDGQIDAAFAAQLRSVVGEKQMVWHRAIDVVAEPTDALRVLADAGCDRVLTSGGKESAWSGRELLRQWREKHENEIEILPAAGISSDNAAELLRFTNCRQLHGSFSSRAHDPAEPVCGSAYTTTDEAHVARVRAAVDALTF